MAGLQEIYPFGADQQQTVLQLAQTINEMIRGRANNVGTVTLTANSGTTVVDDNLFGPDMAILFMPLTANAAAEYVQTTTPMYVSSRDFRQFTITHRNNAQTDRTFAYVRIG